MPAVASARVMLRSCLLALLACAALAPPALAVTPTFDFPVGGFAYDPPQITLSDSDTSVCWSPQGSTFASHPLTFDTGELTNETSGTSAYCPSITGLRSGFYAFHCAIHGHQGQEGSVGTGMTGSFTIPGDTTATPDFSTQQSGAAVTFTYTGGSDPDVGDSITKYLWDFDGNGTTDATTTDASAQAQHTYTANGMFHPTVRVIDLGHVLSAPATHDVTITGLPDPTPPPNPAPGGGGNPPPGGGPGDSAPAPDTTAPVVKLTLAKRLTVKTSLRLFFTTDEPTAVTATLKVGKKTAKARKAFGAAGRHTLTIKLSKALRRLLRHRRAATLTLAATDDSGNRTTLKRTLKLRAR
jgi:plastocyanin